MKTTLDLPDDLMRAIKIRAAEEGRKMKDIVAEFLRRGLSESSPGPEKPAPFRVKLPLVEAGETSFDLDAERIHELEMEAETERIREP